MNSAIDLCINNSTGILIWIPYRYDLSEKAYGGEIGCGYMDNIYSFRMKSFPTEIQTQLFTWNRNTSIFSPEPPNQGRIYMDV